MSRRALIFGVLLAFVAGAGLAQFDMDKLVREYAKKLAKERDPRERAAAARYRRKRAGHLLSKGRYLAAQILAMLDGDLWLRNARAANHAAARLAEASGADRLLHPVEANEMFVRMTAPEAAALRAEGFDFYDWGPDEARLVTAWDTDLAHVDALAAAIRAL